MSEWEDIEAPRGTFIGWGTNPGQTVIGTVVAIGEGTNFGGDIVPELTVELTEDTVSINKAGVSSPFTAGELVAVTAGSLDLERKVKIALAQGLKTGDMVRVVLDDLETTKSGNTVKMFKVQVKHAAGGNGAAKPQPATVRGGATGNEWGGATDEPPW